MIGPSEYYIYVDHHPTSYEEVALDVFLAPENPERVEEMFSHALLLWSEHMDAAPPGKLLRGVLDATEVEVLPLHANRHFWSMDPRNFLWVVRPKFSRTSLSLIALDSEVQSVVLQSTVADPGGLQTLVHLPGGEVTVPDYRLLWQEVERLWYAKPIRRASRRWLPKNITPLTAQPHTTIN